MKRFTLSSRRCIAGKKKMSYDVDVRLARLEGKSGRGTLAQRKTGTVLCFLSTIDY